MISVRNGILYKSSSCLSSKSVAVTFYKDARFFFIRNCFIIIRKRSNGLSYNYTMRFIGYDSIQTR